MQTRDKKPHYYNVQCKLGNAESEVTCPKLKNDGNIASCRDIASELFPVSMETDNQFNSLPVTWTFPAA